MPADVGWGFTSTTNSGYTVWPTWASTGTGPITTVWPTWVVNSTATTAETVWVPWVTGLTATSVSETDEIVWPAWTETIAYRYVPSAQQFVETPAEREARLRQAEERRAAEVAARLQRDEEKALAVAAAEKILQENLNRAQRKQWKELDYFEVLNPKGERFRLKKAWSYNVIKLDDKGNPVEEFCVHTNSTIPIADNLLGQKLHLEIDGGEEMLKKAYKRPARAPALVPVAA